MKPEKMKEYMQRPEVKERRRLWMQEWRKNNPVKLKQIQKDFRVRNKEKISQRNKANWANPEFRAKAIEREVAYKATGRRKELRIKDAAKRRKAVADYVKNNPEWKKAYMRKYKDTFWIKYEAEQRELLDDKYVIKVVKKQSGYTVKTKDISKELIEIKRNEILVNRIIKQINIKENGKFQNSRPS